MALAPGAAFGPYEILAPLGAGGMGEVYRARDRHLQRDVAIKVLHGSVAQDPDRLRRFEREARVLASLNHPHIGAIFGVETTDDGTPALVLELVEGPTLADRITQRTLTLDEALPIARQIADALEAAHEQGIVHRDLKPANIKVRPDGTVKVLDFGLAKVGAAQGEGLDLSQSATAAGGTREGTILGTPAYMSPEQVRGKPADKRSDIWAFGCVLYEALTGRAPSEGETFSDTISAILARDPDWRALPAETPPAVRRLLHRCLEKDPKRRLHDIADARIELDDVLSGGETDAALLPAPDRAARRWRAIALASIGAAGVVTAVLVALRLQQGTASAPAWSTAGIIASQLTSHGGTEGDSALSPDGKSFAFVSNHGGTTDIWLRQVSGGEPIRLTQDEASEEHLVYAPGGDTIYFTRGDGGGQAIWRIGALGGQAWRVIGDASRPAISPDGGRLAYLTGSALTATLVVSALDGRGARTLARDIQTVFADVAWSPDGRWLSYVQGRLFAPTNLFVVDVASGQSRQVTRYVRSTEGITSHAWLPDNRHLAVSYAPGISYGSDLGVLDVRDGSLSRLTANVAQRFRALRVSSDGSRLIATAAQEQHELWKVPLGGDPEANGRAAVRMLDRARDPIFPFVSRDGRTLLFASLTTGSREAWIAPLDGSVPPRQITAIPGAEVSHASLSPDGRRIAFASRSTGHSDIWTQRVDGSDLRQITNDDAPDSWPVWSPDGQWLVFSSIRGGRPETLRIAAAGGPAEKLVDGFFRGDWIGQPAGTGTWLVSSDGSRMRLIDVERRTTLWEEVFTGGGLGTPVFSADGRRISALQREARDRTAIWILDAATRQRRLAVRFPPALITEFRACWVDEGRAFIVSRHDTTSHIVLFDRFWSGQKAQSQ